MDLDKISLIVLRRRGGFTVRAGRCVFLSFIPLVFNDFSYYLQLNSFLTLVLLLLLNNHTFQYDPRNTYNAITKGLVESSHVEEHPLVHLGPSVRVAWVELLLPVLAVLAHQVSGSCSALSQDDVTVDHGGNGVLRIQL